MERSKLSLKWLEVFQAVARFGSVQEAASELDLSISTVSHHLGCLEEAVGLDLIDHGRRPMKLTRAGEIMLRHVDDGLLQLRKGMTEVWSTAPDSLVRHLSIALVEDLDNEATPALAVQLAEALPVCQLTFLSRPSHDILSLLQADDVDIGIASAPEFSEVRLDERPLLRDPYVLIVPRAQDQPPAAYLNAETDLAFLRYSKKQLIGRRVEVQLRRLRKDIPHRMEFESTEPILALVAAGRGWTITTALNFASGHRHHDRIRAMPFEGGRFARRLSLFRRRDLQPSLMATVDDSLRPVVQSRIIAPTVAMAPWLDGDFALLTD